MLKAMPSPKGTNLDRRFIIDRSRPSAAYDAALSDESALKLLEFLRGKLSDEDLSDFCKLAGVDAGVSMDDGPEPFPGMPLRGGGKFGQDILSAALRGRMGQDAKALAVSDRYSVEAKQRILSTRSSSSVDSESFAARFPHAARIGVSW